MTTYRVRDWEAIYENNRTKELKRMSWVPIPNKMDGDGYTELVDHEHGAAHFGAWVAIIEIASKCETRGTLVREGGKPHDARSLARMSRLPVNLFEEVIPRLIGPIGWLEVIETETASGIPQDDAGTPRREASEPQESTSSRARAERNGTEGNGKEEAAASAPEPEPPSAAELRRQLAGAAASRKMPTPIKPAAADKKLEIYQSLRESLPLYPGADRLPGTPDDAIIGECIDLARGDPKALGAALHRMIQHGKKPSSSWKWFPTVLKQYLQGSVQ